MDHSAPDRLGPLSDDPVLQALLELASTLRTGDRLPAERDLALQLSVSRGALRDRIQTLEAMGLVERRVGSGAFIRSIGPETVAAILSLGALSSGLTVASMQPVRVALERQAAKDAASRSLPAPTAIMATMVKRMSQTDDPDELYEADIRFHRALFEASDSPALIFFSQALAAVLSQSVEQRRARMLSLQDDVELMTAVHGDICKAIVAGDERAAMDAVDRHFAVISANSGDRGRSVPKLRN